LTAIRAYMNSPGISGPGHRDYEALLRRLRASCRKLSKRFQRSYFVPPAGQFKHEFGGDRLLMSFPDYSVVARFNEETLKGELSAENYQLFCTLREALEANYLAASFASAVAKIELGIDAKRGPAAASGGKTRKDQAAARNEKLVAAAKEL